MLKVSDLIVLHFSRRWKNISDLKMDGALSSYIDSAWFGGVYVGGLSWDYFYGLVESSAEIQNPTHVQWVQDSKVLLEANAGSDNLRNYQTLRNELESARPHGTMTLPDSCVMAGQLLRNIIL